MQALETMEARYSVRSFTPQRVRKEDIDKIARAISAAPCGMRHHAKRHVTFVTDEEALDQIRMASTVVFGRDVTYGAPLLVVVSSKPEEDFPGLEKMDAGCMLENALLEATELKLGSVYLLTVASMVISGSDAICKKIGIPEGFAPVAAAGIGHAIETPHGDHIGFSMNFV